MRLLNRNKMCYNFLIQISYQTVTVATPIHIKRLINQSSIEPVLFLIILFIYANDILDSINIKIHTYVCMYKKKTATRKMLKT